MPSKTWQPGDDKPRTPRAEKKRDVELYDGKPTAPPASPHRPNWRAPDDWREAAMAAQRGEVNNAAEAQKILDSLNSVSWDKPPPRPNPPAAIAPRAAPPAPAAINAPQASRAITSPAPRGDDCDCIVLNLGRADPDCPKCGGTGYTGP